MDFTKQGKLRTVDEHFDQEHRALEHILGDVQFLIERRSFMTAAKRFGEFRRGIEQHLAEEDEVLCPLFIERTGDPTGIVTAICAAHDRLRSLMTEVASAISQWDHSRFCARVTDLDVALKSHHVQEERLLHPALDSDLRDENDWYTLVQRAHHTHQGQRHHR